MSETAKHVATWKDVLTSPDDGHTYEVVGGELEAAPRPAPHHGRAQGQLYARLSDPFDPGGGEPGLWWLLVEPDVQLSTHDIVVPDLAGWRRERLPQFPRQRPIDVVPDWICEVVSPDDRGRDRVRKADLYLRSGVVYYWLLDPTARTLEAMRSGRGAWVRIGAWADGDDAQAEPFEEITIQVSRLLPP